MSKEDLKAAISAKEKDVKKEKQPDIEEGKRDDLVDEDQVDAKVALVEERLTKSPLGDSYKGKIKAALDGLMSKRQAEMTKVDAKSEDNFKKLFADTLKDLEDFDKQDDIRIIYETLEPFFENSNKIVDIINFVSYKRSSGYWQKINKRFQDEVGIDQAQIEAMQKLLGVRVDGKVGPETMMALFKMMELGTSVKFGKKTLRVGEEKSEEEKEAEDPTKRPGYPPEITDVAGGGGAVPAGEAAGGGTSGVEGATGGTSGGAVGEANVSASEPPLVSETGQSMPVPQYTDAGFTHSVNPNAGKVDLKNTKPTDGFAKLPETQGVEQMIERLSGAQKQEVLKAVLENMELTKEQKYRLQQVAMIRSFLDTVHWEIQESHENVVSKSTWGERFTQMIEPSGDTHARILRVSHMINSLSEVEAAILADPTKSVHDLISPDISELMAEYKYDVKNERAWYNPTGKVAENDTQRQADIQSQYVELIEFMRGRKNYAGVQTLIEENLLVPYFEKEMAKMTKEKKEMAESKAMAAVGKRISVDVLQQWRAKGMDTPTIEAYRKQLVEIETRRELKKEVAAMNNGLPFQLRGYDQQIQEIYKDMMGTGEWHNFSDATWDTIMDEVIVNAPLIIVSGGAGSLVKAGLSAGARAVVASGRLASIGLKVAEGAKAVEATGRIGKALYWGGRAGGLLAEGAVFEAAHTGLSGENLFAAPDWFKRILYSSATLGAFHISSAGAKKLTKFVAEKGGILFPDKTVRNVVMKVCTEGSIEVGTMLAVAAVQHGLENGDYTDWDTMHELFHVLITVGALKVSGGAIKVGSKIFRPQGPGPSDGGGKLNRVEALRALEAREEGGGEAKALGAPEAKAGDSTKESVADGMPKVDGKSFKDWFSERISKISDIKFRQSLIDIVGVIGKNVSQITKKSFDFVVGNWTKMRAKLTVADKAMRDFIDARIKFLKEYFEGAAAKREADREARRQAKETAEHESAERQAAAERARAEDSAREKASAKAQREKEQEARDRAAHEERQVREEFRKNAQDTPEARGRRINPERKEYDEVKRESEVFYMPDIHGDITALKNSMFKLGLIDRNGKWSGGKKVLQFSGDYVDRGKNSLDVLDFLVDIEGQAREAGGRVDLLVGNHEAMMIGALLGHKMSYDNWAKGPSYGREVIVEVVRRYGLNGPDTTAQALEILKRECFEPGGRYFDLIRSMKVASQVDDVLYVHAGVSPRWANYIRRNGVDAVNYYWEEALLRARQNGDFQLFDSYNEVAANRTAGGIGGRHGGLFWMDFEAELESMTDAEVASVAGDLKAVGINAIMVGHTIVNNPRMAENFARHGIKIIASDVGMSSHYGRDRGGVSGNGGVRVDVAGNIDAEANGRSQRLHQAVEKKVVKGFWNADGTFRTKDEILSMDVAEIRSYHSMVEKVGFCRRLFGLRANFGKQELGKAFRALTRQFHPDYNGSSEQVNEMLKVINDAKATLDADLRARESGGEQYQKAA